MSIRRAVALASCAILAACSHANGPSGPQGRTLRIVQQWEPRSLNPALENGSSAAEWGQLLFSYLVNYDASGNLVGDAAVQVPTRQNGGISADGLTIVYRLRRNIRFADGTPLTADDCAWSVRAIQNPQNNIQSRFAYDQVASASAPNPWTCVLHLKRRFPPVVTVVLAPQGFPILPRHLLQAQADFNHIPFDAKPLGSGPYVVESWNRGDRVVMRANPLYFKGAPKIARLTIQFVPDPQSAINLLQSRAIDGYYNDQDLSNYPLLRSIPAYRAFATPENAVGSIIFNTQDPLTSQPAVRHALAEAIDVRTMVSKAYRGAEKSRDAGKGLFLWAYDPKAFPDVPYNPAHARRLLDGAGWRMAADGLRHRNGKTLALLLIIQAATPIDAVVGNVVAQYERAVGVSVTLKSYNITQFVAPANEGGPVYGGKFQMAYYDFQNGDDPDTTDQFACKNVPPNGYNKSRLCDPVVDELLAKGMSTYDRAARKAVYAQLQRRLYADLPLILTFQRRQLSSFSGAVNGVDPSLWGPYWNIAQWSFATP